jgi:hypothetical protein
MKITKFYFLFAAAVIIFLYGTAYFPGDSDTKEIKGVFAADKKYDNSKIIKFDHKLHVVDAGVKCEDCHAAAKNSVSSKDNLNPKKKDCESCHDVKDTKKCNLCHYEQPYKKLKSSDHELNFSHKQHIQGKQCTDCHKDLDKVKFSKESAAGFPSMESCYSCHNNNKAPNNCESCHNNLTNLTPKDHLKSNFLNEHKTVFGVSEKNNCMMCHSDNFCQACHSPLEHSGNNTKDNFFAPYYTKENGTRTDRGKLQKLTTAHDLNYRFTHGLDANQKSFECKSCHDPVTFCSSCHQDGGDLVTGISPKSHQQPNFTTLGVNTGGGLHSALAKKDIESCQSCHDVEGSDPACLKCHFDNDGVKGTNPKTHEKGFLSDEKGIWHETKGAVCYSCHTDANAKPDGVSGVGFCGYCHGRKQ